MDGRSTIDMNAKFEVISVIPHVPDYRNKVTDAMQNVLSHCFIWRSPLLCAHHQDLSNCPVMNETI